MIGSRTTGARAADRSPLEAGTGAPAQPTETLAVLEGRLARAAGDVLEATRAAAFDPGLAAGGSVGAVLCLAEGDGLRLVAAAEEGLPLAGPLLPAVAAALLPHLAGPGDVAAAADPGLGLAPGEVAMARGAYREGRLAGVAASLVVHDGLSPALVVTPVRLVRAGEPDAPLLALVAANSRRPGALRGDLLAQASGLAAAIGTLERLAGAGGLEEGTRHLAAAAEASARAALRGGPPDEPPRSPEAAVTAAEPEEAPAPRLRLTLVPDGAGGVALDFAGSDLYRPGLPALPARRAAALARLAVAGALPEVPLNAGLLAAIDVRLPGGTVLDPRLPPESGPPLADPAADACLAQRLIDLVNRALSRLVPARARAGSGDGGTLVLTAPDSPERPGWRLRLPLGGGDGASVGADGLANVPTAFGAAPTPSIEALEAAYPLRVVRYGMRDGSAGPGRYRGGPGTEIEIELLPGVSPQAACEWRGPAGVTPPGVLGGGGGAPGEVVATPGRIVVRSGGGGGYGNPYERAIRLVLDDVGAGLVGPAEAKRAYGVALRPGTLELDEERTYRIRNYLFTSLAVDEV